ncbi:hypothetical protein H6F89_01775 [Cyanobacteria bacterium FACHB-63]|nr:hypothetical protein [Cyanobacteria bacterium FACHB-63]
MQPLHQRQIRIEVKVQDSVEKTYQAIEADLQQCGKWSSWVVIDADRDRQSVTVIALVIDPAE